jgi:hypothetical protein
MVDETKETVEEMVFNLPLPKGLLEKLEDLASKYGRSRSALLEGALIAFLKDYTELMEKYQDSVNVQFTLSKARSELLSEFFRLKGVTEPGKMEEALGGILSFYILHISQITDTVTEGVGEMVLGKMVIDEK